MKVKVVSNQGFYIARYEASNNGGKAESKCLKMPWNNISWNNNMAMNAEPAEGTVSYEGRHASEKLGYTSVQSTLVYGAQWDSVLKFIENTGTNVVNSISWGNHSETTFDYTTESNEAATKAGSRGILIPTGATARHMKQNISDIAGNVWEWTMEAFATVIRSGRGGGYNDPGTTCPAAYRLGFPQTSPFGYLGFRVALYIK